MPQLFQAIQHKFPRDALQDPHSIAANGECISQEETIISTYDRLYLSRAKIGNFIIHIWCCLESSFHTLEAMRLCMPNWDIA